MKSIGGQAVIEGVMMKAPGGWTVAVRDQSGEIHLKIKVSKQFPRFLKLPLLRGIVALFQALSIGVRALEFSASKAYNEEEKPLSPITMAGTMGFAIVLGVGLFILLPLYVTKLAGLFMYTITVSSFVFNIVDGLLRVFVFLSYVSVIGLWKDMRRIFEYHGAEHKVIHAYEAGMELIVENVRPFSTLHPRCGTSFLLIVMAISVLIFSFIPSVWPFLAKFLARVILIPMVAGISYEFLKLSAIMKDNPVVKLLIIPGLMLQRLTTKEPDVSQIEVAITAVKEALKIEESYVL